ncbi:HNH endonuclease signature motif containing protein [Cellulomonas sp. ATA003]|uniref:HNH endonuclease signature motif containing protein n=1 Tax=Cellulomonas sp. ATA003 TaxID=3073064 RepID=UPI0037BF3783
MLCETHHVDQWARDHGTTSVTNGILLCWHHHDLIHRMNITITRDTHTWRFTDRFGNPIRSTMDSLSAADPPGTDGPG